MYVMSVCFLYTRCLIASKRGKTQMHMAGRWTIIIYSDHSFDSIGLLVYEDHSS
jgi:hypothetical protein